MFDALLHRLAAAMFTITCGYKAEPDRNLEL